ncbi:transposase (fragment) [Moritella yayanosii]|uniref:Transposase n=1 Tax=Moritella yayanosii TaxID=69539 RepID=A0A330LVT8_9GAMM
MFGEGEWKVKKHGSEKRRTWRKLHMAVDVDTHEIISVEMTLVNVGDSEVLPSLINPLRRRISEVSGDGTYDTKESHKILNKKKIKPLIPPLKSAGLWEAGHARNEAVIALKAGGVKQWKVDTG